MPTPGQFAAWDRAVAVLKSFVELVPKVAAAVEAALSTGGTIRPEVEQAYDAWVRAAERIKQRIADMIEGDQGLASAVDATGPSVGFAGVKQTTLEAYFSELSAAAPKVVQLLREPVFVEYVSATMRGRAVEGLAFGGFGQIAQVAQLAVRVIGPLWRGLLALLETGAVRTAGATAVGVMGLESIINSDSEAYFEHEKMLNKLVAEGALTVEEYEKIKPTPPSKSDYGAMLVLGAVGLGALALILKNRRIA